MVVGHSLFVDAVALSAASPVPFRKDHLNMVIRASLSSRAEPGEEVDWTVSPLKLPSMDDSDVPLW